MVWSGAVASATPMVPATGALFEDEGHVPGAGRARHRRRRRLRAAAANDDLLAGAQVLGLHRYQTSPSTSSPAPSCFAVRGLIAVGLPKLLSQASAARLDDMYGLSGKRYRRSSSRTAAANAADGGRCGESSAVAGWEEAAAIGMWRMEQWQHCGPALSRTAHRPRSLR
jgi:hypothetical protein